MSPNNQSASAAGDKTPGRMNAARIASIITNFDAPVVRDASYVEDAAPIGSSTARRTSQ